MRVARNEKRESDHKTVIADNMSFLSVFVFDMDFIVIMPGAVYLFALSSLALSLSLAEYTHICCEKNASVMIFRLDGLPFVCYYVQKF